MNSHCRRKIQPATVYLCLEWESESVFPWQATTLGKFRASLEQSRGGKPPEMTQKTKAVEKLTLQIDFRLQL